MQQEQEQEPEQEHASKVTVKINVHPNNKTKRFPRFYGGEEGVSPPSPLILGGRD